MSDRLHAFEALDNFRDFGGHPTADGRRVRKGRLYRAAHQARLTEGDVAALGAIGLGCVVDLRRPGERRDQPSRRPADFDGLIIEGGVDDGREAPHMTFLKSGDLTPDSGRRFMSRTYAEMMFDPAHQDVFSRYFRHLADSDRPVLIHCAAGKDRTGVLAALTLHLLGVDRETALEDYLETNRAVDLVGRAPAIARQIEKHAGRRPSDDAVVAFLGVEAAYLDTAFAAAEARYGSLEAYADQALGLDDAARVRMVERLVE